MAAPPVDENTASSTISMQAKSWEEDEYEQFSFTHRINGFPWRLRLTQVDGHKYQVSVLCDKSNESELWQCTARFTSRWMFRGAVHEHTFASWDLSSQEYTFPHKYMVYGNKLDMQIETLEDGDSWNLRPPLDQHQLWDGILLIGAERKKLLVNKRVLASQSTFFHQLFFDDLVEKQMIWIGGEFEDVSNIIKMLCYQDDLSITDTNLHKVLAIACKYKIKIVVDRVASHLLSPSSAFSLAQKLLITEQFDLPILQTILLTQYSTSVQLRELCESPEFEELSKETLRAIIMECGRRMI